MYFEAGVGSMNLADFLDSYIVMKNLSGFDWTFWEQENTEKLISFYIETEEKIEITLIKAKVADLILIGLYFPNSKHKGVDVIDMWKKARPELKKTYGDRKVNSRSAYAAMKISVGVKNVEELKEFFDKVF
jgi:hypothetical protein